MQRRVTEWLLWTMLYWANHFPGIKAPSTQKYLGCYKDQPYHRLLDGTREVFNTTLRPELCVSLCFQRGYPFAGVQNGQKCFCGHQFPPAISKTAPVECNIVCSGDNTKLCGGVLTLAAYETGIARTHSRPRSRYIGCFKDQKTYAEERDNSILKGYYADYGEHLTPSICDEICYRDGFLYFGLTMGNSCYCGDQHPSREVMLPDEKCYKSCSGDTTRKCGGSWEFSIYATGISDMPADGNYIACAKDSPEKPLVPEFKKNFEITNSPRRCINICGQYGFKYSGVMNESKCYCGNDLPGPEYQASDADCEILECPGDPSQSCGNTDKLKIYNTYATDIRITASEEPPCEPSQTTVNGQNVCQDQTIFTSNFSAIDTAIWKYNIQFASKPEYEFVTYGEDSKNIYVKDNKLFIKPTVQSNDIITSGSITLPNCTGTKETEECERTAVSFNILPPVQSAKVSTENSFSFRYGIMQIKAKLPSGDWIVPNIWLEPKNNIYGEDYLSGKIKLALARGNKELLCNNRETGSKILEGGVFIRTIDYMVNRTFSKESNTSWTEDSHFFTLMWTPENLSFLVDGEFIMSAIENDKIDIREMSGITSESASIWSSGSKLAPFDQEFILTIGLSVGGMNDFPDNCYSNGSKKPWTNHAAKAMLRFWQDREHWQPTWQGDKSALQIEEIKIKAL